MSLSFDYRQETGNVYMLKNVILIMFLYMGVKQKKRCLFFLQIMKKKSTFSAQKMELELSICMLNLNFGTRNVLRHLFYIFNLDLMCLK